MFKNRKLIIGLMLLAGLLLVLKSRSQPAVIPLERLPQPKIESPSREASLKIESRLQSDKISIPNKLPVYTLSTTPVSLEESVQIATNLGFTGSPQVLNDARFGTVYIWSEAANGNLRIVPTTHIIDYKTPLATPKTGTTFQPEEETVAKAKRFLISRSLTTEDKLSLPKVRYIAITDESYAEVNQDLADLVDIIFIETINGYQLVNPTTEIGTINVKIDRNNNIVSVYVDKADQIVSAADYKVKTFSELVLSLGAAKIQSLDNGNIDPSSLPASSINKIVVNNANIAYFQELSIKQQYLQPVFVLEGTALLDGGQTVPVLLYLSAL